MYVAVGRGFAVAYWPSDLHSSLRFHSAFIAYCYQCFGCQSVQPGSTYLTAAVQNVSIGNLHVVVVVIVVVVSK